MCLEKVLLIPLLLRRSSTSIKTQDKKRNKTQDNKSTNQYKVNVPN